MSGMSDACRRYFEAWRRRYGGRKTSAAEAYEAGWVGHKLAMYRHLHGVNVIDYASKPVETDVLDRARTDTNVIGPGYEAVVPTEMVTLGVNPLFEATRLLVRDMLAHPFDNRREWTVQGLGMLRTYFDAERRFRLHIWNRALQVKGVTLMHDHPWHFRSYVISGELANVRFEILPEEAPNFNMLTIKCGVGACQDGKAKENHAVPVHLRAKHQERYLPGQTYKQQASEVHASFFADGTVTLLDRTYLADPDTARVFFPIGERWIDAEPRVATEDEVWSTTRNALERF